MKLAKLLIGLLLLPACFAATIAFREKIVDLLLKQVLFLAGAGAYLFLLAVFQQPIRTYVFGHELTHVLWIWLFGGKVKKFKVSAAGGGVRADRANFLIFLAPYFFPVYTFAVVAAYLIASALGASPVVHQVFSFVAGFTWTFHLTFTIYTLLQRQPDISVNGSVFSLPLIYLANVIVLSILVIFISGGLFYESFFARLWEKTEQIYFYLWVQAPRWSEDLVRWCRFALALDKS